MSDLESTMSRPQVGGDHYQTAIQPIDFIQANGLGFCEGNVVKYLTRFRRKGTPRQDLMKARQYIDFLLEEYPETASVVSSSQPQGQRYRDVRTGPAPCGRYFGNGCPGNDGSEHMCDANSARDHFSCACVCGATAS